MTVDFDKPTLVTGASGMVGNNLVRHLLGLGRTVRVFVRQKDNRSLNGLNVETFVGDVLNAKDLTAAMKGVSSVFHLAGAVSIDGQHNADMMQVNVKGTSNVVAECLAQGVDRLIHFSSIHAMSHLPKNPPVDEQRVLALDPETHLVYDQSKAAGECEVLAGIDSGLDAVILNPVGIVGPNDFGPSPAGEFLLQLIHRRLPGLVAAGYYWVDVRDVANAAVSAESNGTCGEKYILSSQYVTFNSFALWVEEVTGVRPPLFILPIWMAKMFAPIITGYSRLRGIRPLVTPEAIQIICCHQKISTEKAATELGFQARQIHETVVDTVRWLQSDELINKSSDLT